MASAAHDHHGHHGHGHDIDHFGRAFAIGVALNLGFVGVEVAFGLISGSVALLADAGHNLSDVFGLLLAWGATLLARRRATARFTYGLQGASILAALGNALLLLIACAAILWEAVRRFADPAPVEGVTMMAVAGVGIVINLGTALLFARGRHGDLNIRGAFLHMIADALVSAGVVISGLLVMTTGLAWIDPATSLVIVGVIVAGAWGLLRDSGIMALNGVPREIDRDAVAARLATLPGVAAVHHVHIWPTSTAASALTAHLAMPGGHPGDAFLADAAAMLDHDFAIAHATLQIEIGDAPCGSGEGC